MNTPNLELQRDNHREALALGFDHVLTGGCDYDDTAVQTDYKLSVLQFSITEKVPGNVLLAGDCKANIFTFSILQRWAVDSNGQCWVHEYGGKYLTPVTVEKMMSQMEVQDHREAVQSHFGIKRDRPTWYGEAIRAGWIPPQGVYAEG